MTPTHTYNLEDGGLGTNLEFDDGAIAILVSCRKLQVSSLELVNRHLGTTQLIVNRRLGVGLMFKVTHEFLDMLRQRANLVFRRYQLLLEPIPTLPRCPELGRHGRCTLAQLLLGV